MMIDFKNMEIKNLKSKYCHIKIKNQIKKYDKDNLRIFKYFKKCN